MGDALVCTCASEGHDVCPGQELLSAATVGFYAGCTRVVGDLVVPASAGAALVEIAAGGGLAGVVAVDGSLRLLGAALARAAFPRLANVTGDLVVESPNLASLSLPALREVGGHVVLAAPSALETLFLPALRAVGGHVAVENAGALRNVTLPALERVGDRLLDPAYPRLAGAHPVIGQTVYEGTGNTGARSGRADDRVALLVRHAPQLRAFAAPRLASLGGLGLAVVGRVGRLRVLDLRRLARARDVFLGVGPDAVAKAGHVLSMGRLYYLFLKE